MQKYHLGFDPILAGEALFAPYGTGSRSLRQSAPTPGRLPCTRALLTGLISSWACRSSGLGAVGPPGAPGGGRRPRAWIEHAAISFHENFRAPGQAVDLPGSLGQRPGAGRSRHGCLHRCLDSRRGRLARSTAPWLGTQATEPICTRAGGLHICRTPGSDPERPTACPAGKKSSIPASAAS